MVKTAADLAPKSMSMDFSMPDTNGYKVPKMQIRSYRIVPTQMYSEDLKKMEFSNAKRPASRELTATVTLPMPQELQFTSSFDWSAESRSMVQNFVGNFNAGEESIGQIAENGISSLTPVAMRTLDNLDTFGGSSILRNAGYATDTLKEMFFRGHDHRSFNWSWDLSPRNAKEAESMMKLMRKMEIDAHPERFARGVNILPNEYEISWLNAKLPLVAKCVCTGVVNDYAASGAGTRFKFDGFSAFMTMSLSFREIELVDRLGREKSEW